MATISFNMPGRALLEVQQAICTLHGYQAQVPGQVGVDAQGQPVMGLIPNPETPAQFVRRTLVGWLREQVRLYRRQEMAKRADTSDIEIS